MNPKRPSRRTARRKSSTSKQDIRNIITTIVFAIALIVGIVSYMHDCSGELPLRQNKTRDYDGERLSGHVADLDMARTPLGRYSQIIRHKGYVVSYNEQWRLPNWVGYELTIGETQGDVERTDRFETDPYVKGVCSHHSDYTHSGYDRGHMAPAADMTWDKQAMTESFYMSNICPQVHGLNAGAWKQLENRVRLWAQEDSAIIVVCGPIVGESTVRIGRNGVIVPEKFYKIVVSPYSRHPRGIAFIFNNETTNDPLYTYAVSIDSVETVTGIDFLYNLPDSLENYIEQNINLESWQL